ncbi:MAG: hypothetical protein IPJ40_16070 [Saprospirales bacterium]|nr:hypothetical protein [Saprospirales bacterium]
MDKKQQLKILDIELAPYRKAMSQAVDTILEQEVSKYPIMVVHQHEIELGIPFIHREEVKGNWSVNASTLEEFVAKRIINENMVDHFRSVYKDPEQELCLFLLSELGAKFIFLPREESMDITGVDFPFAEN